MKALIFDFDGTIADSFETLLAIFEEIYVRPQKLTAAEIKTLRGQPLKEVIRYLKIKRWQIPRLLLRGRQLVSLKMTSLKTFNGVPAVLKQLHRNGYQMYILSTNSSTNISKFLENSNLDGYFSGVYGDIGLRSKTSALRRIMKKERLGRAETVYIGDETRDVNAAHNARVRAVAVTWGFNNASALTAAKPYAIAKTPQDLLKILKRSSGPDV